jgi:hypothetical protein
MYYKTNKTMVPQEGTELAQWYEYWEKNLKGDDYRFTHGAFHAFFLLALFVALPLLATNAIFETKSWKYVAINAGYWIATLTIMGGIIAAWR